MTSRIRTLASMCLGAAAVALAFACDESAPAGSLTAPTGATPAAAPGLEPERRLEASVVQVKSGRSWGSGFAIAIGGQTFVATAFHVVAGTDPITIIRTYGAGERKYQTAYVDAVVEAVDARHDLALLSLPSAPPDAFVPLELADEPATQASLVRAVGFPATLLTSSREMGLVMKPPSTQAPGAVISVVQSDSVDPETRQSFERGGTRMLVVNVAPTHGNSGGPLLDERSQVVGVVVVGDPQHKLQDGAIDAAHLQALVARVEEHLVPFEALGSDAKLAEQSIKQALQGPLALARVLTGPTGDFLDHPDRGPLKDLVHLLLKVYKGLPSDAHADAFQNLFRIFWDSPEAFARSRRASYADLTRSCAREYSALLSDSDVLPEVVGNLVLDCAAERMLPAFAADALHAMLLGEEVDEVLSTSPIDRAEKLFQVQVRLKPSGKVVPLTLVLRRGGWRVVLAARAKGQGLAGRFGLPDDYLARAYSMVCRPGEESDCKLEGDQQRILKGLERYEGDLRVRPLLHGFRWFERNERRLRRGAPETALTLRGVASVAEGELSVFEYRSRCDRAASCPRAGSVSRYRLDSSGNVTLTDESGAWYYHR